MTTCRDTVADWRLIYRVPFAFFKGGEITAGIQKTRYQTQMASTDLKIVTDNIKMEVLDCYLSLLKNRNPAECVRREHQADKTTD